MNLPKWLFILVLLKQQKHASLKVLYKGHCITNPNNCLHCKSREILQNYHRLSSSLIPPNYGFLQSSCHFGVPDPQTHNVQKLEGNSLPTGVNRLVGRFVFTTEERCCTNCNSSKKGPLRVRVSSDCKDSCDFSSPKCRASCRSLLRS